MNSYEISYARLFASTWIAFAVAIFLQSRSIPASVVPALLPTLICLAAFALTTFVSNHFWTRVAASNLLIGLGLGLLHFNIPDNYTSSLGGRLLVHGGRHTAASHLVAVLNFAVIVAVDLVGFIAYRSWVGTKQLKGL